MNHKKILLSFDVEEFDLPQEYNLRMEEDEQFEISKQGLLNTLRLLDKHNIRATFFTTTLFAKKYSKLIKKLKKENHEIACHGYAHSDDYSKDISKLKQAKQEIEEITKSPIKGFRAPRFQIKDISSLSKYGFSYDSSIHPTFIPGRYFNMHKKRQIHKIGDILEIPPSTLPIIRLPIFWLAFKNFPIFYAKSFTKINFLFSDYTLLVLHPWEFADLSKFNLSALVKRKSGRKLIKMLEKYILFCKKHGYVFETIERYLEGRRL